MKVEKAGNYLKEGLVSWKQSNRGSNKLEIIRKKGQLTAASHKRGSVAQVTKI